jgi:hypothetical protein
VRQITGAERITEIGSSGKENTEDATHCDGNRNQLASFAEENRINQILMASSKKTKVTHQDMKN